MSGRGRKRASWSKYVDHFVMDEFARLSDLEIPITPSLLFDCAIASLLRPDCHYLRTVMDPLYRKQIREMINPRFITRILQSNCIVDRKRTGNLSPSVQHTEWTHKLIANYLCGLQRKF